MDEKAKKSFVEVHKGTSRIVLVFPLFQSVVVKVPRIYWKSGIETLIRDWKRTFRKETWEYQAWWSPSWCLFKGLLDNWNEYRFYRKSRHSFLQVTHFSFFGIFNIQRRGQPLQCDYKLFWRHVCDATDCHAIEDGHHFTETDNFCVDGGVRILDYGSPRTQGIILKYGDRLVEVLSAHASELCVCK